MKIQLGEDEVAEILEAHVREHYAKPGMIVECTPPGYGERAYKVEIRKRGPQDPAT